MTLLNGFLIAYFALTAVAVGLYMPKIIGFFSAFKPLRRKVARTRQRRIALVIPARNESDVIADLLTSISRQDYDGPFDIYVIVQDVNDPTVRIAKAYGARVLAARKQTCKGDVLDAFFRSLPPEDIALYDAFAIIDADAVLASDYVRELNNVLEWEEYDIFISRKFMKNSFGDKTKRSVYSNNASLTWAMIDELGNRRCVEKDIPLILTGQGLMVRRKVIEKLHYRWPYHSLTEDYELRLDSLLRGFRSFYCPYAVLYTDETVSRKETYARRLRWLTGYAQCGKRYKQRVRAKAKEQGRRLNKQERECLYGVIPLACAAAVTALTMTAGLVLAIVYGAMGKGASGGAAFGLLTALPFSLLYLALLFYALVAYRAGRENFAVLSGGEKAKMLLFAPLYLLEFIPIYLHGLLRVRSRRPITWKRSKRQSYKKIPL